MQYLVIQFTEIEGNKILTAKLQLTTTYYSMEIFLQNAHDILQHRTSFFPLRLLSARVSQYIICSLNLNLLQSLYAISDIFQLISLEL